MRRLMRRVLVAGAGGGIGMALVDALAARTDNERTYALHRHPVASLSPKVEWIHADPADPGSLQAAIQPIFTAGPLDGVIIATGLLHGPGLSPEKSLKDADPESLIEVYASNAVLPLMLLKTLKPFLKPAGTGFICFLSAQIGSIGDNRLGGWYGYRMAKAALNMAVKTASVELAREGFDTTLVAVHPGTTRTALSHPFVRRRRQPVSSPEEAAARLIDLLEHLDKDQNGAFLNYDGTRLPW
jgi:NAD(P)-dependent dehydrogenase (short-subunit alcohol dehydrogenase family)